MSGNPPTQSFAIVPAAGRSRRMGCAKLLLPWGDRTLIEHVLQAWKASDVDHVIVVVHSADEELAERCRGCGVDVVVPSPPPPEMKDSVRHGLEFAEKKYAPSERDGWLLAPADMPRLSSQVINHVLCNHDPANPRILAPTHDGRRGHPVLFPWPLAKQVAQLAPDEGVNALTARHPLVELEVPASWMLHDVDTPRDFQKLQDRHNRRD